MQCSTKPVVQEHVTGWCWCGVPCAHGERMECGEGAKPRDLLGTGVVTSIAQDMMNRKGTC